MNTQKAVPKIPIISICVPHYGGISSHWWQEFQRFMNHNSMMLQNTGKYQIHLHTHSTQPVDEARNVLIDLALQVKSDYIFWLDSDNIPPLNCISQLMETLKSTGADMVSGLYFSKNHPYYPILRKYRDGGFWTVEDVDFGQKITVDACGFGTCLMKTDILKNLKRPYFKFDNITWGYKDIKLSEDIYFCQQMMDNNMKIICDTNVVSEHYGGCIGPMESMIFKNTRKQIQKLREDLIVDIVEYTKIPREECCNKINVGTRWIKEEWDKSNPETDEAIKSFYKGTTNYIWDLALWHTTTRLQFDIELVQHLNLKYPKGAKILDYGCGIGMNGLMLSDEGHSVTLADLEGYTLDFARYRAKKKTNHIHIWDVDQVPANDKFDVILLFDMIEHMSKAEFKVMSKRLDKVRHKDTKIYYSVSFGKTDVHPMHFDADPEYIQLIKEFMGNDGIII